MADVFQEVDELMKQERLQKIWNEYGPWIIAFMVLTVVFTGGFSIYNSWNHGVQEKQTSIILSAYDSPEFETTVTQTTEDLRPNLRGVAVMTAAAKYVSQNEIEKALPLYKAIQNDSKVDTDLRDLAKLLSIRATLETSEQANISALKAELKALAHTSTSPWQHHAHLEMALILATHEQDYKTARAHLKEILAADALPSSLYEKASALDHIYEIKSKILNKDEKSNNGEG